MLKSWRAALLGTPSPAILLVAVLAAHPLQAQERECGRCLAGHRYLPSSILDHPFAADHFTNSTGGGMAFDLQIPVRDIDGNTIRTVGGDIGFLLIGFEYQKALFRWLALRGNLAAIARVGTSAEAVIASGAEALFTWNLGATVPIWKTSNFLVSGVADYRYDNEYVVDPYGFARLIINNGYTEESKEVLIRDEGGNHWSLGARAAYTVNPWWGLNAVVESGEVDSETIGNRTLTELGLQSGFDLAKLWDFPLGVALGYREQIGPGRDGDASGSYRAVDLGLFFTGNNNFTIGGDFIWSKIAVKQPDIPDMDLVQFRLVTRLDFR
jgi:hypothetical protein